MSFEPKRTAQEAEQDCPICGAFKMSFQKACPDCERQQQIVTNRKRQAARDRKIGPMWPRE